MEILSLVSVGASLFIAVLVVWALSAPFFATPPKSSSTDITEREIPAGERSLSALYELEADYRAEKISKEEYQSAKSELERELTTQKLA